MVVQPGTIALVLSTVNSPAEFVQVVALVARLHQSDHVDRPHLRDRICTASMQSPSNFKCLDREVGDADIPNGRILALDPRRPRKETVGDKTRQKLIHALTNGTNLVYYFVAVAINAI